MLLSSVITTIAGTLLGILKDVWATSQKAKAEERKALMLQAGLIIDDRQDARKYPFQFARRVIVFSFMAVLLAPVYLVVQDPNVAFTIPVEVTKGGFSFLLGIFSGEATTNIQYVTVQGYVYLISLLDMLGFIVGFYFSSGGTHARY